MVTAFVAGMLLSGAAVQAQSVEYRPKKTQPFALAFRLSELLQAEDFTADKDGVNFTWTGNGAEIKLNESEGLLKIKNWKEGGFDLPSLLELVDVPVAKCRVTLTMKRVGEESQTIDAQVGIGTEVKIGGGFGLTEFAARPRRNDDGTFTMIFTMTRDFGAKAPRRQNSMVLKMRADRKVTFTSVESNGQDFIRTSEGGDDAYVRGSVGEPGVLFEATVRDANS